MKTLKYMLASLAFAIAIGASLAFNSSSDTIATYNSAKSVGCGCCDNSKSGTAPNGCDPSHTGSDCVISIGGCEYKIFQNTGCTVVFKEEF